MNTQKGIGIFSVIVIIAIIAVGGYAAVKVSQEARMDAEISEQEKQSVEEAKKDVNNDLLKVRAALSSNLDLNAKVEAATDVITEIKEKLVVRSKGLSATAKAEIEALQARVAELEASIQTDIQTAQNIVDEAIVEISESMEADVMMESEGDVMVEGDDSMMEEGDSMMTDEESTEGDSMMEAEADVSSDTSMEGEDTESETNVSGSVEVQVGN